MSIKDVLYKVDLAITRNCILYEFYTTYENVIMQINCRCKMPIASARDGEEAQGF